MKKYLIILILFLSIFNVSNSQTWKVIRYDNMVRYFTITAYDSLHYALSARYNSFINHIPKDSTFISITSDGGKTWKSIWHSVRIIPTVPNALKITELAMLSPKIIIAGVEGGWIIRTSDGGDTWDTTFTDQKTVCTALNFANNKYGAIAFQESEYIYVSDDSGKTWIKILKPLFNKPGISFRLYYVENICRTKDSSLIIGFNYYNQDPYYTVDWIVKTIDKGRNWKFYMGKDSSYIVDMNFYNNKIGWKCGINSLGYDYKTATIYKTIDGGQSWQLKYEDTNLYVTFSRLVVFDENNVIALHRGEIVKTTNGGDSWFNISFEKKPSIGLRDIAFGNNTSGLIVGTSSVILSNTIKPTNINVTDNYGNNNMIIYPNPLIGNILNLNFSLQTNSTIKIDLINSLGIKVGKTLSDYFNAGSHTIRYSPDANLPSGTYWIRMTINNKETIVKPVVIIK